MSREWISVCKRERETGGKQVTKLKKTPCCIFKSSVSGVGVCLNPDQIRSICQMPSSSLNRAQAFCTGDSTPLANGWRDHPPYEPLPSFIPLPLQACVILPLFEVMDLDNKLVLDVHHGKRKTFNKAYKVLRARQWCKLVCVSLQLVKRLEQVVRASPHL